MDTDAWTLLAETRPPDGDPALHADALAERLVRGGIDEVRRFGTSFDAAMDALYRWDLWGAAYLALGGCSDDAFEYLRAWIVARGEADWRRARMDPQGFFLSLLGDADDPEDRFAELGLHDGEALLYAAGTAHERLTGEWRPPRAEPGPDTPSGEPWEEDDLPERFPELAARLPDDLFDDSTPFEPEGGERAPDPILDAIEAGLLAYTMGNHRNTEERLGPLVDDREAWALVDPELQVEVAYVVSAIRLQDGKVDAAAESLSLIEDRLEENPRVRRLLAQIELARGELERAGRWVDRSSEAVRMDRALAAKLAWREGRRSDATTLALGELDPTAEGFEHPWDVAGALYHVGSVLAEAGNAEAAERAVRTMATLLGDAPDDLPLLTHMKLLVAAVTRLRGRPADALAQLEALVDGLEGTDRAEALRETARSLRDLGRGEEATAAYRRAVGGFEAAGERWEGAATRREMEER